MKLISFISVLFLLSLTFYFCFHSLDTAPIERWDEQTNIQVVKDTITQKSFPILYLDGKPFFEKPPIWYYLNIAIGKTIDVSPFSMRISSAIAGFLLILSTTYFAWKWWGKRTAIIAWIILLATNHLFVNNPRGFFSTHTLRSADLDSLFILFLVLSFGSSGILAGIFAGLAMLTKGPMGILPLLVVSLLLPNKKILHAWTAMIITVTPWYVYMITRFGEAFLSDHFGYHLITRTLMPIEGHANSPWYYVTIFTNRAFFSFWELVVLAVLWILYEKLWKDKRLLSTLIVFLLFFLVPTIVQTKLAWYILPVYPFVSLIIAAVFSKVLKLHS